MIRYLSLDYIEKTVVPIIHEFYVRENNPGHDYFSEPYAIKQLEGCLERMQWDYEQGVISKAVQLFLCVNKGHYFENGNKRLSLVVVLSFLLENKINFRLNLRKDDFCNELRILFPEVEKFEDDEDFTPIEFAYYNLTIFVANSGTYGVTHDKLKQRVKSFFEFSTVA